jgi:phosphate transport system protein
VAEDTVLKAVHALIERDTALAQSIIDGDREMDRMEVEMEEDCLKVVALHQPVAADLRFIVAILKINNDLERIGDLAVHIAEKTFALAGCGGAVIPPEFHEMTQKCRAMFKGSLDALVNLNGALARSISLADDEVDQLNRRISVSLKAEMRAHPEDQDRLMSILSCCRNMERIADHATNIAEDVIYLVEGEIVRHKLRDAQDGSAPSAHPAH